FSPDSAHTLHRSRFRLPPELRRAPSNKRRPRPTRVAASRTTPNPERRRTTKARRDEDKSSSLKDALRAFASFVRRTSLSSPGAPRNRVTKGRRATKARRDEDKSSSLDDG